MDDDPARERLTFLGRRLPASFELRVFAVDPGRERPFDDVDWRDALVVVERGEIELECDGGTSHRFRCGAVLWLIGLPLRTLRNRGPEPALLVAISRQR